MTKKKEPAKENFKILNLHAENVKRLKVIDITPQGNTVILKGKNGAGKSSVMDCIFWAIAGKKQIDAKPIRDGEDKASITLDMGKYIIKRTFTEKDSYLSVESPDGARYKAPQDILDDMMGSIAFDPMEFTRMKPDEQYEALRALVKLDVDIEALDKLNKEDAEERTAVNREIRDLTGKIRDGIKFKGESLEPDTIPDEPVDVAEKAQKVLDGRTAYLAVQELDRTVIAGQLEIDRLLAEIEEGESEIAHMESQIAKLRDTITTERERVALERTKLDNRSKAAADARALLPSVEAMQAINTEIEQAGDINQKVQLKMQWLESKKALALKEAKASGYTLAMQERENAKEAAIARAELPIEGLGLKDGIVYYQGQPLAQASTAEKIRVSTAIAMAMNPKLRVIRISNGNDLDDDNMATIQAMAQEKDFQVWIECVKSDEACAILIEDGSVAGADAGEQEAA